LLQELQRETTDNSLPDLARLRRGIYLTNQQKQQLQQELHNWQQILQQAPIGYLQVDEENQLLWCNDRARELLEIHRWQEGQVCLLLKVVRSYELDRTIEQTRRQQESQTLEWSFYPSRVRETTDMETRAQASPPPRSRALRATTILLPNAQVGVFVEDRQEVISLSQDREQWFSELAHELKTPLTSIRLVSETLQSNLDAPLREWVDRMLVEINRLIQLVQDWLELSQIARNGDRSFKQEPVDLPSLLRSVWQTLEPIAASKELEFSYQGAQKLLVDADEARLHRAFLNIFDNSIGYTPNGGTIQVKVTPLPEKNPSWVQVDVIDSGCGFSEAELPRIFDRLYRGETSRHRPSASQPDAESSSSGSGLGLTIVQEIIQAHGGSITASNHPETGGAWLQIQLLASEEIDRETSDRSAQDE
jgi:two-component system phosphate regulon sensor histidine kinase PhoR